MCRPGTAEIEEIQDPELKESQNLKPAYVWPSRVLELVVLMSQCLSSIFYPNFQPFLALGSRLKQNHFASAGWPEKMVKVATWLRHPKMWKTKSRKPQRLDIAATPCWHHVFLTPHGIVQPVKTRWTVAARRYCVEGKLKDIHRYIKV